MTAPSIAVASMGTTGRVIESAYANEVATTYGASGSGVLMTGATSGIGFDATCKLLARGEKVFAVCRDESKAAVFSKSVHALGLPGTAVPLLCDLSSLSAVRNLAADVASLCERSGLGALVLNAGVQYSGTSGPALRTADGFEITIGVNHLSHFLLTDLVLPLITKYAEEKKVNRARRGARIVVTASEVHDPTSGGGSVGSPAHLGTLEGMETDGKGFTMVDSSASVWDSDKAYKDSKACNVLFALELARRLSATFSADELQCNCFGPGLITRTDFFRHQNPLFVSIFDFITNATGAAESVSGGGDCLLYMLESSKLNGKSGVYYSNGISGLGPGGRLQHKFAEARVSEEAGNGALARKLWRLSEELVLLPVV